MAPKTTSEPLALELPRLLSERGMSMRALARAADVDIAHLSRITGPDPRKPVTSDLVRRLTKALDLPAGYFPEARRAAVVERVESDPEYRDRLFDQLED